MNNKFKFWVVFIYEYNIIFNSKKKFTNNVYSGGGVVDKDCVGMIFI